MVIEESLQSLDILLSSLSNPTSYSATMSFFMDRIALKTFPEIA
jgi:hypothetical protein